MKQLLLLISYFMVVSLQAQTITFTGAIDSNWNNANNWSLITLPGITHDVVIPNGKSVILNMNANIASIQLAGTANLTIQGNLSIASASSVSSQSTVTWTGGNLSGGGTLNNLGNMMILPAGGKQILGGTTLNNSGTITEDTDWHIEIVDGVLNNLASGTIELKNSFSNIGGGTGTGSHVFNNAGLVKKTGVNTSIISAELHNTGTISVESGTVQLNNAQTVLTGGTYNVAASCNMIWFSTLTLSGNIGGNLAGDINWSGIVNVPVAANFNFSGNGTFNWGNGRLTGGGILTNSSILSMTGAYFGTKYIENGTTLVNAGTIRISTDWSLDITNGTLNNLASGVIDFQISPLQILGTGSGSHVINNAGLIKKTLGTGMATIFAELHNTGTISVEMGYIDIHNPLSTYNGGNYNVATDCYLFNYETVTCSGVLTGVVDGRINWVSDINVPVATTFNFSGNGMINWAAGAIKGGGTLTNLGILELSGGWVGNRFITESTTLLNANTIKVTSDQTVVMNGGTINNAVNATFDVQLSGVLAAGTGINTINNFGILKKSASTGTYNIGATVNNSGSIESSAGVLAFSVLNNTITGTVEGSGAIQVPTAANFTNNGIFAPGGEPGTLVLIGNYESTANTRLQVQLYGLTQGTQYDYMLIQSNAVLDGTIVPELYFDPAIGDSFTIASTWGTITSCSLASTATANYGGQTYTFSVGCLDDNKVILTLTSKVLANENFIALDQQMVLAPNPATNFITLRNDGSISWNDAVITDCSGRIIKTIKLNNTQRDQEIRIDGFAAGHYFMKINSDDNSIVKRFIVQ